MTAAVRGRMGSLRSYRVRAWARAFIFFHSPLIFRPPVPPALLRILLHRPHHPRLASAMRCTPVLPSAVDCYDEGRCADIS